MQRAWSSKARNGLRRLIVNADDFGRSHSINEAVIEAHRNGILTTASLMVRGEAVDEAVRMAWDSPNLGVGLHLTLVCGRSVLSSAEIPDLVDGRSNFDDRAARTGWRYFFRTGLRLQLAREIHAQFDAFRETGLRLDHLNGHLNLHLHPTILSLLVERAEEFGITHMRLTRDPFWFNARLASGNWAYRVIHAVIFQWLSRRAVPVLDRRRIRRADRVFGLLQTGRVDEAYLLKLLAALPSGDSELYCHPSTGDCVHELKALTSARVRSTVARSGIRTIRYHDL